MCNVFFYLFLVKMKENKSNFSFPPFSYVFNVILTISFVLFENVVRILLHFETELFRRLMVPSRSSLCPLSNINARGNFSFFPCFRSSVCCLVSLRV